MADTRRTLSALQTLLADNASGAISAQDVRDFLVSTYGGGVLLETRVASASAALDFTTRNAEGASGATFQSDFDNYLLVLTNLVNATNAQDLWLRVSTDGGATFETTLYEFVYWNNSTSNVGLASTAGVTQAAIILAPGIDNSQSYGTNLHINIADPLNAALNKSFDFSGTFPLQAVARRYYQTGGGFWAAITAVNAVRVRYASGNITSGTGRLYGVPK